MKELGSWIPQLFYDLIGRVAPGAFLLLVAIGLFNDVPFVAKVVEFGIGLETTEAIVLGAVLAYAVGIVLGGLGYLMLDHDLFVDVRSISAEIPINASGRNLSDGQVAYLYDKLQFRDRFAGARLAKLMAERYMCSVLLVGSLVLICLRIAVSLVSVAQSDDSMQALMSEPWLAILGLIATIFSARATHLHLAVRSRRLLVDYCELLTPQCSHVPGPDYAAIEAGTDSAPLTRRQKVWLVFWWGRRHDVNPSPSATPDHMLNQ